MSADLLRQIAAAIALAADITDLNAEREKEMVA